jgi:hypothetical protein
MERPNYPPETESNRLINREVGFAAANGVPRLLDYGLVNETMFVGQRGKSCASSPPASPDANLGKAAALANEGALNRWLIG